MPLHLFKLAAALQAHLVINHLFISMNFLCKHIYLVYPLSPFFNVLSAIFFIQLSIDSNLHNLPQLAFAICGLRTYLFFVMKVSN